MRRTGAAGLLALVLSATGLAAMERTVLVFGGPVTLNNWGEIVTLDGVTYSKAVVAGAAVGWRWDLPSPRFQFSMEAQLARYFGAQETWEVNVVPWMIHYVPRDRLGPLNSLGFGLGFSYASEPPDVEIARRGATTREKWYWALEATSNAGRPDREIVMRIHHRSTGNGTVGNGASTNAVVLGIRQSF